MTAGCPIHDFAAFELGTSLPHMLALQGYL